jgi:ABC-type transport system substrate-binding protein
VTPAYDSLIRHAPNGSYVSGLATSWKYTENNKAFQLTIRHNVKFADGEPLTANSVVASLKYVKDTPGSMVAGPLSVISSITAPTPDTVLIRLASNVTDAKLWTAAAAAVVYSIVRFVEAYGLWHRRIWAEWFALLSGAMRL